VNSHNCPDPDTSDADIPYPERLNRCGLLRNRVVRHPDGWSTLTEVSGRIVGVPHWGELGVLIAIATESVGVTSYATRLTSTADPSTPAIPWHELCQRHASGILIGTTLLLEDGLERLAQPDVFRFVTVLEMLCPPPLGADAVAKLEDGVQTL
jgi:hypothetical protein